MSSRLEWFKESAARFSGQLLFDEPLSKHTYYRIGGPAGAVAFPKCVSDLQWLAEGIRQTGACWFILGAGSNVLVSDAGYDGLVIRTTRLNLEIFPAAVPIHEAPEGSIRLRTGASVAVSTLLRRAAQEGWAGLEFMTGIPGSIGGVVTMNAGTHLGEAGEKLLAVEAFPMSGASAGESFDPMRFEREQMRFQYRKNLFLPAGSLIWAAEWDLKKDDPAKVKSMIDQTLARRKATQPIDFPSCGSVFKNPRESGLSAWQVIDKLGLRGHRIGDAQFAEKHSNFILNLNQARAADVTALIQLAQGRAARELGVRLEEEVIYLS